VPFLDTLAGRLSRHRRSKFAGLVLLLGALFTTGGVYAAVSPSSADEGQSQQQMASQGHQLFLVSCSFCHGQNAEGIMTASADASSSNPQQWVGPSLVGVGAASVDFQMKTGRMPLVQAGQQAPSKPVTFTDENIADIAAYIASLAPGPAVPTADEYDPATYTDQERAQAVALGGQIFLTNCTACHNFTGAGGAMPRGGYAPSILKTNPQQIYEALLTGPGPMDTFSNGNLAPSEKKAVIAYIQSMANETGYGGFSLGNLGPVSEGLFAWVVGIGLMIGFAVWITSHTTRTTRKKEGQA
jgi:ubiquinol-cytochrome c reductase cytochrome c subunit